MILAIVISLMAGGLIGTFFMAACQLAGREERELEKLNKNEADIS